MKANIILSLNKSQVRVAWQNELVVPTSILEYETEEYFYTIYLEREYTKFGVLEGYGSVKGIIVLSLGQFPSPLSNRGKKVLFRNSKELSTTLLRVYQPIEVPIDFKFKNGLEYIIL